MGLAALLVAVFHANVTMAPHTCSAFGAVAPILLWLRLPWQAVLIWWHIGSPDQTEPCICRLDRPTFLRSAANIRLKSVNDSPTLSSISNVARAVASHFV